MRDFKLAPKGRFVAHVSKSFLSIWPHFVIPYAWNYRKLANLLALSEISLTTTQTVPSFHLDTHLLSKTAESNVSSRCTCAYNNKTRSSLCQQLCKISSQCFQLGDSLLTQPVSHDYFLLSACSKFLCRKDRCCSWNAGNDCSGNETLVLEVNEKVVRPNSDKKTKEI